MISNRLVPADTDCPWNAATTTVVMAPSPPPAVSTQEMRNKTNSRAFSLKLKDATIRRDKFTNRKRCLLSITHHADENRARSPVSLSNHNTGANNTPTQRETRKSNHRTRQPQSQYTARKKSRTNVVAGHARTQRKTATARSTDGGNWKCAQRINNWCNSNLDTVTARNRKIRICKQTKIQMKSARDLC